MLSRQQFFSTNLTLSDRYYSVIVENDQTQVAVRIDLVNCDGASHWVCFKKIKVALSSSGYT